MTTLALALQKRTSDTLAGDAATSPARGTRRGKTSILSKETSDKISFVSFIIPEFAAAFRMSMPDAYRYLVRYGGFDFLTKHWWALHTDNKYWALLSIYDICRNNGGYLR